MDKKVMKFEDVTMPLNKALVNIEAILDVVQWGGEADKKNMLLAGTVRSHAEKVQEALMSLHKVFHEPPVRLERDR